MHMTPAQFFDPVLQSWTIFAWGENNQLHKWQVGKTGTLTYIAQSNEFASVEVRSTELHGGMTGGFCSGSSNAEPKLTRLFSFAPSPIGTLIKR